MWRLVAAISHVGSSLDSGHYYILARDADRKWIKLDDIKLSYVKSSEIRHSRTENSSHMLLYTFLEEVGLDTPNVGQNAASMAQLPPLGLEELPPRLREFIKKHMGN